MNNLSLRLYMLLLSAMTWLQSFAQDNDDDGDISNRRGDYDEFSMDGYMDYQPIHFRFSDVLMVIFLLVACYVFGKIWKGCTYLILIVAVVFYFLLH